MNKKVSIVVPVYNVEQYLERCLNSLVNQTYKNIEIIVVNDGTKDNSQQIIDDFSERYKKVKSFIKENGGLSDARNFGIEKSTGEYICFVDSDDYIDSTFIEKLYSSIDKNKADIAACECYFEYPNKKVKCELGVKEEDLNDLKKTQVKIFPSAWGKIYKKKLFNSIKFKKGIWFEDVELLFRIFPLVKKISIVEEPLYYYIQRDDSITYTYSEKLYDLINNWEGIIDYYIKNDLFNEYKEELEYSYVRYAFATFIKRLAKSKDKEKFNIGVTYAIEKVKMVFPKYKKNKYINQKGLKNIYLKCFNRNIAKIIYTTEKNKLN